LKSYNCKYTGNKLHGASSIISDSEESVCLGNTPVASCCNTPVSFGGSTYRYMYIRKLFSSEEVLSENYNSV
jgi:hypothetical protein